MLHVSAAHSHHQASTEEQIHIRFFEQLGSQKFTVLKYYCLRCIVKLKLLVLKWISVHCNKLKYYVITVLLCYVVLCINVVCIMECYDKYH